MRAGNDGEPSAIHLLHWLHWQAREYSHEAGGPRVTLTMWHLGSSTTRTLDRRVWLICMQNNPLHISLFPAEERAPLEFQFLLSSCLDIFEARLPFKTVDQDFGLLQAVDERLAMYGWLTNTGVKIVVVVDMEGRPATALDSKAATAVGLRDADLKPVSLFSSAKRHLSDHPFLGFQSIADSIHQAAAQSILYPG